MFFSRLILRSKVGSEVAFRRLNLPRPPTRKSTDFEKLKILMPDIIKIIVFKEQL